MRLEVFPDETVAPEDLDSTTEPSSLTDELRLYLQTEVIRRRCEARRIAHLRKMNRRTLSRRLRAEGTTFKQLADEVYFQVAKKLLADPCMSLAQISAILNFSQPSAFTHAFRRWSGITSSAWRLANRAPKAP
jgi:AraC-like DNA-binding protein